jgi:hypothetical protein
MASPDSKSTDDRYATVPESSLLKLSGDLRFAVGDEVLALVGQGLWLHGRITQHWYTDTCFADPTRAVPYQIQLLRGSSEEYIWCSRDNDDIIRAATPANFEATGAKRECAISPDANIAEEDSNSTEDAYEPRFAVGIEVIVLASKGSWKHGRITKHWYNDSSFSDPELRVPYQIQLLGPPHELIWCSHDDDDIIRAATPANFDATGAKFFPWDEYQCPCCGDAECNTNSAVDRMRRKLAKRNHSTKDLCHCDGHPRGNNAKPKSEEAHLDDVLRWNDSRSHEALTPRSKRKSKKAKRVSAKAICLDDDHPPRALVSTGTLADDIDELALALMQPDDRPRLSLKPEVRSSIIQMCLSHAPRAGAAS